MNVKYVSVQQHPMHTRIGFRLSKGSWSLVLLAFPDPTAFQEILTITNM